MGSLRVMIKKLAHKRQISVEECNELLSKLDGHDEQIRADEREKAIKEFADLYREFCITSPNETCLKEHIECDGMCIDCFEIWLKEKKNDKS